MTQVLVTGGFGFLGWHVMCCLKAQPGFSARAAGRELFGDSAALRDLVSDVDVIVHLAGVNRGSDEQVMNGNLQAAATLIEALDEAGRIPVIVYASSIHVDRRSNYGNAKRLAGEMLGDWADKAGSRFVNLILPNVFGEHGAPHYNSVTATFCHQIAAEIEPQIDVDNELQLLHAQQVGDIVVEHIVDGSHGEIRPSGQRLTVSELLSRLQEMHQLYRSRGIIPDVREPLVRDLFNTYRSYLFPGNYPVSVVRNSDNRGHLVEIVKSHVGGQTFFSSTRPGVTRGNHFHRRKIERFAVMHGQAEIAIRRLFDDEVIRFAVSGDSPAFIDMPTMHTHKITNTGSGELLTLFWANEIFDPDAPDTVSEQV